MFTEIELKIFNMNHLQEFKLHKQKKMYFQRILHFFRLFLRVEKSLALVSKALLKTGT